METMQKDEPKLAQSESHAETVCDFWLALGQLPERIPVSTDWGERSTVARAAFRRVVPLYEGDGYPADMMQVDMAASPNDMLGQNKIVIGAFWGDGSVTAQSLRRVDVRDLRGRTVLAGTPYEAVNFTMSQAGEASASKAYGWWTRSGWVWPSEQTRKRRGRHEIVQEHGPDAVEMTKTVGISCCMAFYRHFYWEVEVGTTEGDAKSSPSVSVLTDASGARDFLKLRDGAYSGNRRAALLHWVRQHRRRKATAQEDAEAAVHVREHLRGRSECVWNGLACAIRPAQDEIQRVAATRTTKR